MCGRYTLTASAEDLQTKFDLHQMPAHYAPRYNIAPTQPIHIIKSEAPDALHTIQWGLVPHWAKDTTMSGKLINARAETIDEKPSFKDAFAQRRCLIPANGFYEWQKVGKHKKPHYVHLRDHQLLALAGLWERWRKPDGDWLETCTIITTEPNNLVQPLHHRMAVILKPDDYQYWLDANADSSSLKNLLQPYPSDAMAVYEVAPLVNNINNDTPALIEPYNSPTQPALF